MKQRSTIKWNGMIKITSLTALVLVVSVVYMLMSMFGPQVEAATNTTMASVPISAIDALEASVAKLMASNAASIPTATSTGNSWKTTRMRVTGYCPCSKCCGKHSDGITANGHCIKWGDVFAAADKKYSFGTKLRVPGYNNGRPIKILDRGGAIKGNRLDLFFDTHTEAMEWGVKYLDVKIKK